MITPPTFEMLVWGEAQPAGSKRAFTPKGWSRAVVTDANPKSREWKGVVAQRAGELFDREPLTGALHVEFTFYVPRPKSHYGTGKNSGTVKASAPAFPASRPDLLKLARGVEDALSGIVYGDDAQIVTERLSKRYGKARVEIRVLRLAEVPAFAEVAA